jgi:hypothetical protein
MRSLALVICLSTATLALSSSPTFNVHASPAHVQERKPTLQQQRARTCEEDARTKGVSGEARKTFIAECWGGRTQAEDLTPDQMKMKARQCGEGAKALRRCPEVTRQ